MTLKPDALDEPSETFYAALSNAVNSTISATQGTAVGTITDDDDPPTISIDDIPHPEGNAGKATATFSVSLSGPEREDGDRRLRDRRRHRNGARRLRPDSADHADVRPG